MKRFIQFSTITFLLGLVACATQMKPIKSTPKGDLKTVFSKYRKVFNQHDWEITQSDAEGGFLKATKPFSSLGMVIGIFSSTVSCTQDGSVGCSVKIDECKNTVPLSGCSAVSDYRVQNEETLKAFVNDIHQIQ